MKISNKFTTTYVQEAGISRVDIDPLLARETNTFCPLISVVECTQNNRTAARVVLHQGLVFSVEQARKVGLVLEAAGRLCAMAEDYGSLHRAWLCSYGKPFGVYASHSKAIH